MSIQRKLQYQLIKYPSNYIIYKKNDFDLIKKGTTEIILYKIHGKKTILSE